MSLIRQQIPSRCNSGQRSRNQLIVVHTSEGSTDQVGLGQASNNSYGTNNPWSYGVCFDNKGDPNQIVEMVARGLVSWSAMNANYWGVHGCNCTPNGASANWTRSDWLIQSIMLEKCSAWIKEEAAYYGIPLVKINAADIQAGKKGVCGHGDCSQAGAGGGHFDPGNNFPWDVVLSGTSPTPTPGGIFPTYPRRSPIIVGGK